jgi:thymidylate synthase ThyX
MTYAKIEKDSITILGHRLTTMVIKFPRFILPEFNTHRMLSKNTASSRAQPARGNIDRVANKKTRFIPKDWRKNQPGMQGFESIQHPKRAEEIWDHAASYAAEFAKQLDNLGVHKQTVNRLLEPFMFTEMLVSATEWANFFALRHHPDAQPEMQELAKAMYEAYSNSTPKPLEAGSWHLPFIDDTCIIDTVNNITTEDLQETLIKRSVARCARVSYKLHDGASTTLDKDLGLYDRLLNANPGHMSPFEHQAMALTTSEQSGNFTGGFLQYRKTIVGENIKEFKI